MNKILKLFTLGSLLSVGFGLFAMPGQTNPEIYVKQEVKRLRDRTSELITQWEVQVPSNIERLSHDLQLLSDEIASFKNFAKRYSVSVERECNRLVERINRRIR